VDTGSSQKLGDMPPGDQIKIHYGDEPPPLPLSTLTNRSTRKEVYRLELLRKLFTTLQKSDEEKLSWNSSPESSEATNSILRLLANTKTTGRSDKGALVEGWAMFVSLVQIVAPTETEWEGVPLVHKISRTSDALVSQLVSHLSSSLRNTDDCLSKLSDTTSLTGLLKDLESVCSELADIAVKRQALKATETKPKPNQRRRRFSALVEDDTSSSSSPSSESYSPPSTSNQGSYDDELAGAPPSESSRIDSTWLPTSLQFQKLNVMVTHCLRLAFFYILLLLHHILLPLFNTSSSSSPSSESYSPPSTSNQGSYDDELAGALVLSCFSTTYARQSPCSYSAFRGFF
jgi:hypothetical protein